MSFDDYWGDDVTYIPSCKKCGDGEDVSDPGGENLWCAHCVHDIDSNGDCATIDCSTCDDESSSNSGIKVQFVDPGDGIGTHPGIELNGFIFLMTSNQKRRGVPGYIEISAGEGGLNQTSFLDLNRRFEIDSCTIQFDLEYLSTEVMDEIYPELNRLHSDIIIDNQSNKKDDVWDNPYGDDY